MVLIDTNVVIWMMQDRRQLSVRAAEVVRLSMKTGAVAIASQSLWELALLESNNKLAPPMPLAEYLRRVEQLFAVLPMNGAVAERSVRFSNRYPRDPSDRILGATALVHGLELVTSDERIRRSGEVPCIW